MRIIAVSGAALAAVALVTGCKVSVHVGQVPPGPVPPVTAPAGHHGQNPRDSSYYQDAVAELGILREESARSGPLTGDVAAIRGDAKDARSDAADARRDARGDNTGCLAASDAADDAENIDDLGTLTEDETSLIGTAGRISTDIDKLKVSLSEMKDTGLRPLRGAAAAIAGARAKTRHGLTSANAAIRQINAASVAAYAAANGIAKGACASDSPGSPPPPYSPLSLKY